MSILVTGGTGYIGSHTCIELLKNNEDIIIVDNLSNSKKEMIEKIKQISRKDFKFYQVDLLDEKNMEEIFKENEIDELNTIFLQSYFFINFNKINVPVILL